MMWRQIWRWFRSRVGRSRTLKLADGSRVLPTGIAGMCLVTTLVEKDGQTGRRLVGVSDADDPDEFWDVWNRFADGLDVRWGSDGETARF